VLERLGAAIAPAADPEGVGTAVVGVVLGEAGEVVAVAGAAGALTANCEPVTTVTRAPATTLVGSYTMMTAPDIERATDSAAASVVGSREP
jgi:hypothetical protein